jgi:mitochondrial GTPase 1
MGSCGQPCLRWMYQDVAKTHPAATELNVLVIGMPNVGKSTLLNALRNVGIRGRGLHIFQLRLP